MEWIETNLTMESRLRHITAMPARRTDSIRRFYTSTWLPASHRSIRVKWALEPTHMAVKDITSAWYRAKSGRIRNRVRLSAVSATRWSWRTDKFASPSTMTV